MKYPNFKLRGYPIPNNKLVICDHCKIAKWVGEDQKDTRCITHGMLREGTSAEYESATKAITNII